MGSLTSPKTARHPPSPLTHHGFTYGTGYRLTPGTTIAWAELPSCVTPSLTYHPIRSTPPPATNPEGQATNFESVSVWGFGLGACQRVREYQPVVHRLRLSASP